MTTCPADALMPSATEKPLLALTTHDKDQCKDGGRQAFDFPNQEQCIQFVNTGK